jgi:mono/diheme cytochrome c family protein
MRGSNLSMLFATLIYGMACSGKLTGASDAPLPDNGSAGTPSDAGGFGAQGGGPHSGDAGSEPSAGAGGTSSLQDKPGTEVYQALCAACHGPSGEGTALGPELQHPVADFSTWVVRNGRDSDSYAGPMLAYTDTMVSDQQLEEIWTWLGGLPQPTSGEALYLDYCANCHGADSRGGRVAKNIQEKGNELGDLTEKVREGEGGTNYGAAALYMPHWNTAQISNEELALIAEHLTTL